MILILNATTLTSRTVAHNLQDFRNKTKTCKYWHMPFHCWKVNCRCESMQKRQDAQICTLHHERCLAERAGSVVAFRSLFLLIPPQRITEIKSGNIPSISPAALLTKQLATRFTTTARLEETRVIPPHRKPYSTLERFINKFLLVVNVIQPTCPDCLVYNSHCGHQSLQDTETSSLALQLEMVQGKAACDSEHEFCMYSCPCFKSGDLLVTTPEISTDVVTSRDQSERT